VIAYDHYLITTMMVTTVIRTKRRPLIYFPLKNSDPNQKYISCRREFPRHLGGLDSVKSSHGPAGPGLSRLAALRIGKTLTLTRSLLRHKLYAKCKAIVNCIV